MEKRIGFIKMDSQDANPKTNTETVAWEHVFQLKNGFQSNCLAVDIRKEVEFSFFHGSFKFEMKKYDTNSISQQHFVQYERTHICHYF